MELMDRSIVHVTLVLALAIYAIASAGISLVASPDEASLIAAVQRTPLALGLRLELNRGCLTLAVLAQLRQEHYGYALSQDFVERIIPDGRRSHFARPCGFKRN